MNKNVNESKNEKSKFVVRTLLIILIILFLLSLLVLIIRIGNFLPNGTDILFIEPKDPEFVMEDDKQVWDGETEIEIFSISHTNGNGEVTVLSGTGDNIIAPGMEGYYKFSFKNVGNIAIDYDCNITAAFEGKNIEFIEEDLPFEIRLKDYKGNYVIGNDNEWESVSKLVEYYDEQTVGKNCYVYYELEWRWPFESGNDELDTLLGNMSAESGIKLVVSISVDAVQNDDLDAEGGLKVNIDDPRTGGNIVPVPYILLNILILIILAILIYMKIMKDKKEKAEAVTETVAEAAESTIK